MYQKVDTNLNFVDREKQVEKFWKENHIFEKSMEDRKDDPTYMFYDGPPTANGKPHIGHVLTRVIKDMIPRYRTMKGYMVPRKAGWDTHGLPVELEVEKKLGLDGNMTGTVLNDDVGQATKAAEATKLYVEGSAVEQYYWVDYVKVTKDNASQYVK